MEEREAVERLRSGDIAGLEALVKVHQTRALRAAYLITRDRASAEDVVQGAFVRSYERAGQLDPQRPFGPWFARIVVNDAVKEAARRERTVPFLEGGAAAQASLLEDPGLGPQEEAEAAEARRWVWAALGKLPPAQRAAVVQRYYLGMSEAEMSERDESPPGTNKSRLYAARKGLSKLLRPELRAQDQPASARPAPAVASPGGGKGEDRD